MQLPKTRLSIYTDCINRPTARLPGMLSLVQYMRVNYGRADVFVAQEFLGADIVAHLRQAICAV